MEDRRYLYHPLGSATLPFPHVTVVTTRDSAPILLSTALHVMTAPHAKRANHGPQHIPRRTRGLVWFWARVLLLAMRVQGCAGSSSWSSPHVISRRTAAVRLTLECRRAGLLFCPYLASLVHPREAFSCPAPVLRKVPPQAGDGGVARLTRRSFTVTSPPLSGAGGLFPSSPWRNSEQQRAA
jgi:hypothetical protein